MTGGTAFDNLFCRENGATGDWRKIAIPLVDPDIGATNGASL
jgi:hypothetical protein